MGQHVGVSDEKPALPRWWTSGVGPLAIGGTASLVAAVLSVVYVKTGPPDGFGTLILISLIADVAAWDNATDLQGRRDGLKSGAAVAAAVVAVASGFVAYGMR